MSRIKRRLLLAACMMVASAGAVRAQQLGASYTQVQARYAEARRVTFADGRRGLELADLDYAGVHWRRIEFVFGPGDRLARLTMSTRSTGYEKVIALAERDSGATGLIQASDGSSGDLQIRICESSDGEVSLTYEPLARVS